MPDQEELLARAQSLPGTLLRLHPFYRGKIGSCPLPSRPGRLRGLVQSRRGRPLPCHPGGPVPGVRTHEPGQLRRDRLRRDARAGPGRHRPGGRVAGDGRQGAAVQVPRRRGRDPALPGHEGPRGVDPHRQAAGAVFRRHQSRGHLPAEVFPHPGRPAGRVVHPRLARRPAGDRHRRPGGAAGCAARRWQEAGTSEDCHDRDGGRERRHLPAAAVRRREPGRRRRL
jgi:hypothetical protein